MTRLEKAQAIATIASPILIAILGFWIQRTLAVESTKQGYVEQAVLIFREDMARRILPSDAGPFGFWQSTRQFR